MLGFPKSGGFTSLFGGQESTSQTMNSVGENSQMKKDEAKQAIAVVDDLKQKRTTKKRDILDL